MEAIFSAASYARHYAASHSPLAMMPPLRH
jgi:hypothetical protein